VDRTSSVQRSELRRVCEKWKASSRPAPVTPAIPRASSRFLIEIPAKQIASDLKIGARHQALARLRISFVNLRLDDIRYKRYC
jgi:hypothetical protein